MEEFNPTQPIVLGIAGESATGKSTVADALAPQAQITGLGAQKIKWSHLFYAMPLYELAAIRRTTEGTLARDRQQYQIHNVLVDLFGKSPLFGAPRYDDLIIMVKQICDMQFPLDGEKPREFFQKVGDLCKSEKQDVFVSWMMWKINEEYSRFMAEAPKPDYEDDEPDAKESYFGVVISDIRYEREAQLVKAHNNGILLRLEADDEVRAARQANRDGFVMAPEHKGHNSETSLEQIPRDWYDEIIDTTELSIKEVVARSIGLVERMTDINILAEHATR